MSPLFSTGEIALSLIDRIRDWKPFGGSSASAANHREKGWTPTQEGWLNTGWDPGWWQQNLQPLNIQGVNSTVEACISALSQTAAMCPIHLMDEDDNGTKNRLRGSNPERVFHSPNDYETRSLFINNLVRSVYYSGDGIAVGKTDDRGAIKEMHLMNSRSTRPVMDPESGEVFYWASPRINQPFNFDLDEDRIFPARMVLHLRLQTDTDPLRGITPLTAAANAIQANSAMLGHQANFFTRMSRPAGVLSTEQLLNKDQMKQLREGFKEQSAEIDSGGIPVLGGGLKFQQMSLSSQDAQLAEAFGMTVADIARAFRIPPAIISHMEGATFNNSEMMMGWFLSSGLGYLIEALEQEFGRFFNLPFSRKFEIYTNALLRSDRKSRMEALKDGTLGGIYSPDEARAEEGLPPVADGAGAVPRVQQQVVPLNWDGNDPAPAPAPEPTDEEVEASLRDEFVMEKAIV